MDIFKDRIKPLIDASGLDDKEIEEAIGLPRGVIYKWGTGKYKSYMKYIPQLAVYFHVSPEYLLGTSAEKQEKTPAPESGSGLTPTQLDAIEWIKQKDDESITKMIKSAKVYLDEE